MTSLVSMNGPSVISPSRIDVAVSGWSTASPATTFPPCSAIRPGSAPCASITSAGRSAGAMRSKIITAYWVIAPPSSGFYTSDTREAAKSTTREPDSRAGVWIDQVSTTTDTRTQPVSARIAEAAGRLGLDRLETAVMGTVAAPELDPRWGRVLAYLNGDP